MKIPDEFKYLATCFYSRSNLEYATTQEWVRATVRKFLSTDQRKIVSQFLNELFGGSHSDEELQGIWKSLDSDYWFSSGAGVRAFMKLIRDACEERR
jgi:hypothetical protein